MTPSERLEELVASTRRNVEQASMLVWRAKKLRARQEKEKVVYEAHRSDREAWAGILARLPADPDHKVVVCAECHRARGVEGWTALPAGIEDELRSWNVVLLSHSYCPDCLRRMEDAVHPG